MSDLEKDGLKNQAEGKLKKMSGAVRDAAADLTGDSGDNLSAKAKRLEGEAQDQLGRAQRKVGEHDRKTRDGV